MYRKNVKKKHGMKRIGQSKGETFFNLRIKEKRRKKYRGILMFDKRISFDFSTFSTEDM